MPIVLRPLILADATTPARVRHPSHSSGDEPGDCRPAPDVAEDGEALSQERLTDLRRRVLGGHYELPDALAALARRLLDVLR